MNKLTHLTYHCGVLLSLYSGYLAADERIIELTDGSVISGELKSLNQGVYTIQSGTLGTLQVEEAKIKIIRVKPADSTPVKPTARPLSSTPSSTPVHGAEMQAIQGLLLSQPGLLDKVMELQNDPSVQEILADPKVMGAVTSGDIDSLTANPQFMQLLENAKIKDITQDITDK
jgi:hypothetical protein